MLIAKNQRSNEDKIVNFASLSNEDYKTKFTSNNFYMLQFFYIECTL